ncbi:MAG: hypothetical protein U1F57_09350 [bacterium]
MGPNSVLPDMPFSFVPFITWNESVLSRSKESASPFRPALTVTQNLVDQMMGRFVEEATDVKSLSALMAGGIAYRLGKVAALTTPLKNLPFAPLRHGLAGTAGLSLEVTVFEGVKGVLSSFLEGEVPRQGEKISPQPSKSYWKDWLSSFLNFGTLKLFGHFSQGQNFLFQHLVQDTAMVAGNHLIYKAGLGEKPEGALAEQFLRAEITNLQLAAGTSFAHHVTGGRLLALERGLDLAIQAKELNSPRPPFFEGGNVFAFQVDGDFFSSTVEKAKPKGISPHLVFSVGQKATPAEVRQLEAHAATFFPVYASGGYAHEFLVSVLRMSLPHPAFRERLLEAYSLDIHGGGLAEREIVNAIEQLFQHDALEGGIGSIEEVFFQYLFRSALSEDRAAERVGYLHELFRLLESEPGREALESQAKRWGLDSVASISAHPQYPSSFQNMFQRLVDLEWGLLCGEHRVILLNFVHHLFPAHPPHAAEVIRLIGKSLRSPRYPLTDVEEALDAARRSPFGLLMVQRMFQVMATQDVRAKIKELQPPKHDDHFSFLWELARGGASREEMALRINGTRMTAYLQDLRLAQKVVDFYVESKAFMEGGGAGREKSLRRLTRVIEEKAREGRAFTVDDLLDLLRVNDDARIQKFFRDLERGRFQILMLPSREFSRYLPEVGGCGRWGGALFIESSSPFRKDTILMEEIPRSLDAEEQTDLVLNRMMGVIHEWGHFLHVRGEEGERKPSSLLSLSGISRQDRLSSELMASLEEHRWRAKYTDIIYWELSAKLGMNFPLYLRNMNDRSYFEETNRRLLVHFQP